MSFTTWQSRLTVPVSPKRDHIRGPIDAPVTLLEYGDFECPFCGQAHLVVKAVEAQFGNTMNFAFRHFPLTTVHPHAELAAICRRNEQELHALAVRCHLLGRRGVGPADNRAASFLCATNI